MKENKELNRQIRNVSVDKNGRPTIDVDERKSIYKSISEALKAIPITNRNVGLTISIYNGTKIIEYWWEKGIKDSDLVKKINTDDIPRIDAKLVDLQNQVDSIFGFEFKIVLSLPTKGKSGIIYVVPAAEPTSTNIYDEYFWIESAQTYERWGGVDPEGDIVINNAFTFNKNHFNVVEKYGIQNVSLKCDILDVTDKGFDIYKLAVGEDDNELLLSAGKVSRSSAEESSYGGTISLNGKTSVRGRRTTTFDSIFSFSTLSLNSDNNGASKLFLAKPNYLKIADNTNYIELSGDNIAVYSDDVKIFDLASNKLNAEVDKVLIKAVGNDGFNINYDDDYGIKGFSDNNTEKILLYTPDNKIVVTNSNIELNIAVDSYINLNYDIFNATFNQLIYLNAPTTKVKKVLFEQNSGSDIYLEPYHEVRDNNTYHGLKSESNIYITNSNSYFIKNQNDYSLTSYGLNGIKHRNSNEPRQLGYNILNIGDSGVLSLGRSNELTINDSVIRLQQDDNQLGAHLLIDRTNNEISLQKGNNTDKFIKINKDSNIILKNGVCEIKMIDNEFISLIGNNGGNFTIDPDGWCIIQGYEISKIGLLGTNNEQSYFVIEEGDYTLPDIKIHQNLRNYIYLYKNNDDENHIDIKSEYFEFKPGHIFTISNGNNFYKFILNNTNGITLGKTNKININDNNIQFTLGSKVITIDETGISDGTNTKTWAKIFS